VSKPFRDVINLDMRASVHPSAIPGAALDLPRMSSRFFDSACWAFIAVVIAMRYARA
jgi:hypothetical protein